MKAIQLLGYGGVDQLKYNEVPTPKPKDGQILVKVLATSVNPVDFKIRSGAMQKMFPVQFPAIVGSDVCGQVSDVGARVGDFKPGDRVLAFTTQTYAEYVAADAAVFAIAPDGMSDEQGGAIPLVVITGAQLIEMAVKPGKGQRVLVTGAAGSVGRTAVFVAKQHGAHVIAGVRAKQKDQSSSIGADEIIALDDDAEIASLGELDVIADAVGGPTLAKLLPKLKKGGTVGSTLGMPEIPAGLDLVPAAVSAKPDAKRLAELAQSVQSGALKIPVAKVFPLAEAAQAQELVERGVEGKVVLIP